MSDGMNHLRSLCEDMKSLQDRKQALEDQLSEVNKELDFVRTKKIPELMETLQVRTATFQGLGRVQLAADLYASTKEGKKDAAMTWLRDCGYGDMIVETYNASSLKALFRRQLADGVEIPSDIFSVTPFTRASIVKG